MTVQDVLQAVQFVEAKGKRFAILTIEDWEALIEWLETIEDYEIVRTATAELQAAGGNRLRAGWLAWEDVDQELDE